MSTNLFAGIAPPNVTTTQTSQVQTPTEYNNFLLGLGQAGQTALNAPVSSLVAPLSNLQNSVYGTDQGQQNTANLLQGALSPINSGVTTAATAAQGVGADQINNFLNPYITDVNNALETNTQQNINQSVLPALQAFGAGSGNTGSSRLLNATGQTLGQIQQGLGAQESSNLATGFQNAVTNALQNQQNLGSIANIQGTLGNNLMNSTVSGLNEASSLGAQNQAQQQAIINAPLNNATNVAALLRGYTIPSTTTQTSNGPASSYGASPLSQIAGLGSLFASGNNGTSAVQGFLNTFGLNSSNLTPNWTTSTPSSPTDAQSGTTVTAPSNDNSGLGPSFDSYLTPTVTSGNGS
jgi:hypothetical protein